MLKIFWNGYHLLLILLTDKVNYLWIHTARNPSGIDITRALSMELEAALVEEEGFMVDGGYGAEHREGDGWLE